MGKTAFWRKISLWELPLVTIDIKIVKGRIRNLPLFRECRFGSQMVDRLRKKGKSNMEQLIAVIDALPEYLKYVYPGYISIYLYMFFKAKTVSETKGILLKSVVISYLYVTAIDQLSIASQLYENFWLILISVVFAYIAYLFTKSDYTRVVLDTMNVQTTFYENEMDALLGDDSGAWLCVYIKDENLVYEGWLHYDEMEAPRKYISLTNYRKYMLDEDGSPRKRYIEEHDNDHEEEVLIFWDEIKRIEKRKTT